jgi:hypothetical protein
MTAGQSGQFLATAIFAAVVFLLVTHRSILARFLAALLLRRKRTRANHGREDRHQDYRRGFIRIDFA